MGFQIGIVLWPLLKSSSCRPILEARKLERKRVLQPRNKERRETSIHHDTSMFQRFGVYCGVYRAAVKELELS